MTKTNANTIFSTFGPLVWKQEELHVGLKKKKQSKPFDKNIETMFSRWVLEILDFSTSRFKRLIAN